LVFLAYLGQISGFEILCSFHDVFFLRLLKFDATLVHYSHAGGCTTTGGGAGQRPLRLILHGTGGPRRVCGGACFLTMPRRSFV
jgi:hypothetical protein